MAIQNEPFYNRERERRALRQVVESSRAELFIVYGRRGIGKSALLRQALAEHDGPAIFYRATRRTLPLQLRELTEASRLAFPHAFLEVSFTSFGQFLAFLTHETEARQRQGNSAPVIAVIDELPYLADVEPGLLTVLQHWWDDNKRRFNLKLFLAGSYMAFMERQVLDANAPLYNRRTGAMKLEPLDYAEAALFFPQYAPPQKMEAYAILGGMPSYLEQFDARQDIADNIRQTVLRQNTYLAQEPDWLLLEDLRREVVYGSILRAVAGGARKPSDIARAIGKDSAQEIGPHLASLQELGLLAREVPVTERRHPRSRVSLYFLADNYLDFWYRFIDPARSLMAQGLGAQVWERTIAPSLAEYVSRPAFERACRQCLWRALRVGDWPLEKAFTDIGAWWGSGDREIDIVALDAGGKAVLAGSCQWTNAPMDVREYAALQRDLALASLPGDNPTLVLFSRTGFTPRLLDIAASQESQRLLLVDLEQMYRV